MNSRERILLALNHKEADRVPLDLGGWDKPGCMFPQSTPYVRLSNWIRPACRSR